MYREHMACAIGMSYVLAFDVVVFMWQRFVVRSHIPFPQPDPDPLDGCAIHAVTGRDDPALRNEGSATSDAFRQKVLLNQSHLPRVTAKLRVLAANDAVRTCLDLTAFWKSCVILHT